MLYVCFKPASFKTSFVFRKGISISGRYLEAEQQLLYNCFMDCCLQDMPCLVNECQDKGHSDKMVILRWGNGDTFSGYFEGGVRSGKLQV